MHKYGEGSWKATTSYQNYIYRNHYKGNVLAEASVNITAIDYSTNSERTLVIFSTLYCSIIYRPTVFLLLGM